MNLMGDQLREGMIVKNTSDGPLPEGPCVVMRWIDWSYEDEEDVDPDIRDSLGLVPATCSTFIPVLPDTRYKVVFR